MWKFDWKMSKEKWLIMLVCGVMLMFFAVPTEKKNLPAVSQEKSSFLTQKSDTEYRQEKQGKTAETNFAFHKEEKESADQLWEYEQTLEKRVRELLKNAEGVGKADVMITLKSSKEKILHTEKEKSRSKTDETDRAGGSRNISSESVKETALMEGNGQNHVPVIEKELPPEIAGIVITAQGGGNAAVKKEISEAMQALFNLPPHKIKVLKRVE